MTPQTKDLHGFFNALKQMTESNEQNPYRPPNANAESGADADAGERTPQGMAGKLLVLSTFQNSVDAHLFKNELENQGIRASINNETTTAIFGATIGGPSSAFSIEVLIMESDAEQALEIKNQWSSKAEDSTTVEIAEWTCKCGETVDEGFSVCWNCGADHGETSS